MSDDQVVDDYEDGDEDCDDVFRDILADISIEMRKKIAPERVDQLVKDMDKFFRDHLNEDGELLYSEMAFILASALHFIFTPNDAAECDCESCQRRSEDEGNKTVH